MHVFRRRSAWIFACALGASLGACRQAASNTDSGAGREVVGTVKGESAKVVGAASERVESRTTEEWLTRALELGAMTDAAARKQALATLLAGMDNEARAAVLETLWAMDAGAGRAVFAELFTLWCEGDPQSAAKWAVTLWDEIPGREGEQLREQAGFAWAKRDFDAAFAWSLSLRDVSSEWGLAAKILKELALSDPRRALELARGVSDAFYATALNRIFAGWVEHDPAAAFAELGVACKESSMLSHQLGKWADRDPVSAVRWAMANGATDQLGMLGGAVRDKGALVMALYEAKLDWSGSWMSENALSSYLRSWIDADPARALVWLDSLPAGEEKEAFIARGAGSFSYDENKKYIPTSMPLILRMAEVEARERALSAHLLAWSRSDPEAALQWVSEHREIGESAYSAAISGAIGGMAKENAREAITFLDRVATDSNRAGIERELAASWAASDALAATAWLNERQPGWLSESWGNAEAGPKYEIVAAWLDAEPDALFAWAKDHPDESSLMANAAVRLAFNTLERGGDVGRALGFLLRLPDSPQVKTYLSSLTANMMRRERGGAARFEALLDAQPGMTTERKREILEGGEREIESWRAMGLIR